MEKRWSDYACFPANGKDFELYVGTLFEDCGYKVRLTPATNDYGVDLLLEKEPDNLIAVQTKFYNHSSLGNSPIQEVVAGMKHWNASAGWVVTNGRFSKNAKALAESNCIRLIDNDDLNALIATARSKETHQHNDLSGIDRLVMPIPESACRIDEHASSTTNDPRQQKRIASKGGSNQNRTINKEPSVKTYNMNEVKIRWGCSSGYVEKQISYGMPMHKLPNGRWSIDENDLVLWENRLNELRRQESERSRRASIIAVVALCCLFLTGAITLFLWPSLPNLFQA